MNTLNKIQAEAKNTKKEASNVINALASNSKILEISRKLNKNVILEFKIY